jgi:hypothetical protein
MAAASASSPERYVLILYYIFAQEIQRMHN